MSRHMQTYIVHSRKHAYTGITPIIEASQQGGVAANTMKEERGWEGWLGTGALGMFCVDIMRIT